MNPVHNVCDNLLEYKNRWLENKSEHRKNINLCRSCDPCWSLVQTMKSCINVPVEAIHFLPVVSWWMLDEDEGHRGVGRVKRSPHGAFVPRVHRGTFGTVEHPGELVELGNAADDPAGKNRIHEANLKVRNTNWTTWIERLETSL